MSKLDSLVDKIAESLLPKIRRIVREELDYKLDRMQEASPAPRPSSQNSQPKSKTPIDSSKYGNFDEVAKGLRMENALIGGDNPNMIADENNNMVDAGELLKHNPKAKNMVDNITKKDYSHLID